MRNDFDVLIQRFRGLKPVDRTKSFGRIATFFSNSFSIVEKRVNNKSQPINFIDRIAFNNFTVNSVTVIEVYLKDIVLSYSKWDEKGYSKLLKEKITLSDAFELFNKERITREHIISHYYKFQNFASINSIFTDLLGTDFYKEIESFSCRLKIIGAETTLIDECPNWRKSLNKLYEVRNRFVHDGVIEKINAIEIIELHSTITYFILATGFYFSSKFQDDFGELTITVTEVD
jgi:hypothetical protein